MTVGEPSQGALGRLVVAGSPGDLGRLPMQDYEAQRVPREVAP